MPDRCWPGPAAGQGRCLGIWIGSESSVASKVEKPQLRLCQQHWHCQGPERKKQVRATTAFAKSAQTPYPWKPPEHPAKPDQVQSFILTVFSRVLSLCWIIPLSVQVCMHAPPSGKSKTYGALTMASTTPSTSHRLKNQNIDINVSTAS